MYLSQQNALSQHADGKSHRLLPYMPVLFIKKALSFQSEQVIKLLHRNNTEIQNKVLYNQTIKCVIKHSLRTDEDQIKSISNGKRNHANLQGPWLGYFEEYFLGCLFCLAFSFNLQRRVVLNIRVQYLFI